MRTPAILIVLAALSVAVACCCCSWLSDFDWQRYLQPVGTENPTAEPWPVVTREPVPDVASETETLLANTWIPVRDPHELAIRLRGLPPETPRTITGPCAPDCPIGTSRVFHVSNTDTDEQFDVTAVLEYKTEHVYMWVERGIRFDRNDLVEAAERFERQTYVTDRSFFGTEWSPGVDNDPHISILHTHNLGQGTLGYFSGPDEFVAQVREDSNEMEMFYLNMEYLTINSNDYHSTLAHEFQHMIHWYNDRNEDTWLNEGFSDLAGLLNGFGALDHEWAFASHPDTQLTDIDYEAADSIASYGAAYLFAAYFLDSFGPQATQTLVACPENGLASVDVVLADLGTGLTHLDVFADWVIANLLDDPHLGGGRYGYNNIDPPDLRLDARLDSTDYPVLRETTVRQYGADYLQLRGDRPLEFVFTGSTQVSVINAQAHSGQYLWWSNRGDDSDMTLTRAFDLSGVQNATLEFWAWYDIEEDWDYAYVEVSADGGQRWEILNTPSGTPSNPNNNSYGWAYTGRSGGGDPAKWIQERVDLSPYAGREVLVRFEYITDEAVNKPGFVVDDVAIPEIGYFSDFETDDGGWEAGGFVRHANVLPQEWLIQLVLFGPETTVQRLGLNPDRSGRWEIPLGPQVGRAVVVVSALAPVTTEPASYQYEVTQP